MLATNLEKAIIEAIAQQHPTVPDLGGLDPATLEVVRREPTGVGTYVIFSRENQLPHRALQSAQLGFRGEIVVPTLPSGLGAVLDIVDGQVNHLELFTYGNEQWDGNTAEGQVVSDDRSV